MVRKYNPEMKAADNGRIWNTGNAYDDYEARMVEDRDGKWVKLSTYTDEQQQLKAEIDRLKKQVTALQEKNKELTQDTEYPQNYT